MGNAGFNIDDYRNSPSSASSKLESQYSRIELLGHSTEQIRKAVDGSIENLSNGVKSFIIYGEPQSGKTEMMICLTAALLDAGHKIVIVLVNDSVQLLNQNLTRFRRSTLAPAPKNFSDILDPAIVLGDRNWIVFCKKNTRDLEKLSEKMHGQHGLVILDDEADFASPNSKINSDEKTKINAWIDDLRATDGTYIGVTATPARLDLNETFENESDRWIDFPAHSYYTGQDTFFPATKDGLDNLEYNLVKLPDHGDQKSHLRRALLSFFARVAYLNLEDIRPGNYSMLVHTSGKKADHTDDSRLISSVISVLSDDSSPRFEEYMCELWEIANGYFGNHADSVVRFVREHVESSNIVVMNSNSVGSQSDYLNATDPSAMFTIAVGGNIVSRGVTFDNLLTMFFTRDAHRIQQDTYIQRARMFGSRLNYLKWFELHIPGSLFWDWHRCFVFHRLSLTIIRSGQGVPLWLQDNRISAVASGSIKTASVQINRGEIYWDKFELSMEARTWLKSSFGTGVQRVAELQLLVGEELLPPYLMQFIETLSPNGDDSVVVHELMEIAENYSSADVGNIVRSKGFFGASQIQRNIYPKAIHHIFVVANHLGFARVYYRYDPDLSNPDVRTRRLTFAGRRRSG